MTRNWPPPHPLRSGTALDNLVTVERPTPMQRAGAIARRWWPALIFAWLFYEVAAPLVLAWWLH